MAPLQRLSIPCHLVSPPALSGRGHFSFAEDRLRRVRVEKGTARQFELVKKKNHWCCVLDALLCLLILFSCTVETEKEQPILRSKEVEGKLLIGYTEHSWVLLPPPPKFHLSEVQSTVIGRQHLKLILTVKTGDRILQKGGHLLQSSIRIPVYANAITISYL